MKFKWIRYIVEKLPEEVKQKRRSEIEASFTGTKQQLEEKVIESLYEQIKITVFTTIIFLMILCITGVFYLTRDRRIMITRNDTGGETTEKQIRIKTKDEDDVYSLTVRPKGYTKSQIKEALDQGEKYLKKHLAAKNRSLNEVSKNLEMPSKIKGENITVQWQSDDPTVIDEEGNVFSKNVKKDYIVNLDARMECQGEVRILKIPVCVVPGNSGKKVSEKQRIIARIRQLEDKNITKEQFYLPNVIRQGRLLPAEKESQIPAMLFLGIAVIVFVWYHENEKYKEQKKRTRDQSLQEYPQIIAHLILFLGTGLSVVSALDAVITEYEKERSRGNKGEIFVYEQMKKTGREISFGVPQTKAFGDMGKKIGLPSYQKLSVLLVQSITRGSADLFLRLKEEEEEAFFERKEQAKRKGEEASTRLLAPMMIMLVIILVLLMFPALAAFS